MDRQYYIYLLTNKYNKVLYTGVTNNLVRRIYEHKTGICKGFSKKYNLHKLIYYEVFDDIDTAIAREKQIKFGSRNKKIQLVETMNPEWDDLYDKII